MRTVKAVGTICTSRHGSPYSVNDALVRWAEESGSSIADSADS